MTIEFYILISAWVVLIIALIWFVPKAEIATAIVVFLFAQLITWITGLFVVELRWLEYPFRELSYANSTSFTFEFFAYPAITVLFVLHFPSKKSVIKRILYYICYSGVLTIFEVILEKYTRLIQYNTWKWYWTFITVLLTFYFVRRYCSWFQKGMKKEVPRH